GAPAVSGPALRLGPRRALGSAGGAARLAARNRGRDAGPPRRGPGRDRLLQRGGDRGGPPISRRPALPSERRGPGDARGSPEPVRVCVVAEYYPRRRDPVVGIWAHRQALAARDAGADVRVLALERPLPPLASLRAGPGELVRSS